MNFYRKFLSRMMTENIEVGESILDEWIQLQSGETYLRVYDKKRNEIIYMHAFSVPLNLKNYLINHKSHYFLIPEVYSSTTKRTEKKTQEIKNLLTVFTSALKNVEVYQAEVKAMEAKGVIPCYAIATSANVTSEHLLRAIKTFLNFKSTFKFYNASKEEITFNMSEFYNVSKIQQLKVVEKKLNLGNKSAKLLIQENLTPNKCSIEATGNLSEVELLNTLKTHV